MTPNSLPFREGEVSWFDHVGLGMLHDAFTIMLYHAVGV